ncbi:O-antigen ligase family protein [Phycisphaerales bacterium AB-hyl4]|uniref:O-antigen ligase family protein n=1 Tax=Natronomicrosphaera hydrolytica TaxID=3242702 RepID=A0ABV4TZT0_9BACT
MVEQRHVAVTGCGLALLVLVLLPCVVQFLPEVYFDVDPRSEAGLSPAVAFGPTGAAWYQVVAVLVSAVALGVSVWAGAVVRWGAIGLVAVGMAMCAYHLPGHASNALPSGGWLAAAAMGLAAVHVGQFAGARRWLIAGLVAIVVPMGLQAVWYVMVDHPATVASYLAGEAALLESRGWEEGSPQHELYRRRLMDWQAVGAFGLSNVFGSVVAGFTLAGLAVMLGMWRRGRAMGALAERGEPRGSGIPGGAWMLLPVVLLGAVTVVLSRSTGAVLALPAGAVVLVAVTVATRRGGVWRWGAVALPVALVGLAFVAVLVRGAVGPPETIEGERTVLFRFHYWQAAAELMLHDLPGSALLGLGSAGFAQGYLWAKNPLNPEEVTNAHNVFVDYIAMLGVGGWAFAAVLVMWLTQGAVAAVRGAGGGENHASGGEVASVGLPRVNLVVAGLVAGVVFGVEYTLMLPTLVIESALLWLGGALAFVGVMALVAVPGRWGGWWAVAGLLGGATVVLVHNQIEMTFYQFNSAPIVWVLVGLAAAAWRGPTPVAAGGSTATAADDATAGRRWAGYVPAGALALVAGVMVVGHALPIAAQQERVASAARALQMDRFPQAMAWLDEAGQMRPTDATVWRWRVGLRLGAAQQAAAMGRRDVAGQMFADAVAVLDATRAAGVDTAGLHRQYAQVHGLAAEVLDEPQRLDEAIAARERATERAPYSLSDHVELGDRLWERGEREQAADLYRRALQISRWSYLDPVKQLPELEHRRLETRIAAVEAGAGF